jgi:hypothetical protein
MPCASQGQLTHTCACPAPVSQRVHAVQQEELLLQATVRTGEGATYLITADRARLKALRVVAQARLTAVEQAAVRGVLRRAGGPGPLKPGRWFSGPRTSSISKEDCNVLRHLVGLATDE